MKESTFNLTDEQLVEIEKCFEDGDIVELKRICTELGINLGEVKTFDTMSYKLLECIESNDELVKKLRELSKDRKALQKLFPYYQKKENMRYFLDNQDEYQLTNIDLKKMEELYIRGLKNNYSEKIEKQYQKQDKFWNNHGFKIAVIFELFLIIFTYNIFIRQYFITSIIKKANITDAIVLEDKRNRFSGDYLTVTWQVKYGYNVNDVKYEKDQKTMIIGYDVFAELEKTNTIKVYYEKDNPLKVKIYQQGKIWSVCMAFTIVLVFALLIKLIFWKK